MSALRGGGVASSAPPGARGRASPCAARRRGRHRPARAADEEQLEVGRGVRSDAEIERREVRRDLERHAADRRDARDADAVGRAEDLERVRRASSRPRGPRAGRGRGRLEPERAEARRDVLQRGAAVLQRGRDRLLERGEPLVLVEAAPRRAPRAAGRGSGGGRGRPRRSARARSAGRSRGGRRGRSARSPSSVSRSAPSRTGTPSADSFREAIWFSRSRGIFPMMVCSPSMLPSACARAGYLRIRAAWRRLLAREDRRPLLARTRGAPRPGPASARQSW